MYPCALQSKVYLLGTNLVRRKSNQQIAEEKLCTGLAVNFTYPQFGNLQVSQVKKNVLIPILQDFVVDGGGCTSLSINQIPKSLFSYTEKVSIVSKIPIPSSQKNRGAFRNVKNSRGVVVGQIVDGM